MKEFKSYREGSRANWGKSLNEGENLNPEDIHLGAVLRIADAVEIMTKDRVQLEKDLRWYKERNHEKTKEIDRLKKSVSAYKGKYNGLKKRLEVSGE